MTIKSFFRFNLRLEKEEEIKIAEQCKELAGERHFKNLLIELMKEWLEKHGKNFLSE